MFEIHFYLYPTNNNYEGFKYYDWTDEGKKFSEEVICKDIKYDLTPEIQEDTNEKDVD